jgi:hypothetical protein
MQSSVSSSLIPETRGIVLLHVPHDFLLAQQFTFGSIALSLDPPYSNLCQINIGKYNTDLFYPECLAIAQRMMVNLSQVHSTTAV